MPWRVLWDERCKPFFMGFVLGLSAGMLTMVAILM